LADADVARRFFDEVVRLAKSQQLLSAEHFTVDSTLIESWAGLKSLRKKGGGPRSRAVTAPAWSTSVASGARTTRTRAAPIPRRS